jgi:hypothetical protein
MGIPIPKVGSISYLGKRGYLAGECGETKTTKKNKTKKLPWRWDPIHQQAFDDVEATIANDVVLAYPDFTEPFEIYTDASTMQLGAVITQDNRPVAFSCRKLSKMQTKYSVTKIELVAIVETVKEFQGMLRGQQIKVYIDHKNLIRDVLFDFRQSVPMEVAPRGICPRDCLHQRDTHHSC